MRALSLVLLLCACGGAPSAEDAGQLEDAGVDAGATAEADAGPGKQLFSFVYRYALPRACPASDATGQCISTLRFTEADFLALAAEYPACTLVRTPGPANTSQATVDCGPLCTEADAFCGNARRTTVSCQVPKYTPGGTECGWYPPGRE